MMGFLDWVFGDGGDGGEAAGGCVGFMLSTGMDDDDDDWDEAEDPEGANGTHVLGSASRNGSNELQRPTRFDEFVGNREIVELLKREIAGANRFEGGRMRNVLLYGPPGCVDGATVLTGSTKTIRELCEQQIAPVVLTRHGPAQAEIPFLKGHAELYEIITENGSSIKATADHLCLTPLGWVYVSDLAPGMELLSTRASDVPRSTQRVLGSPADCQSDPCSYDGQPHQGEDNALASVPSRGGALESGHCCPREDAQASRAEHSHACQDSGRPSTPNCSCQSTGTVGAVSHGDAESHALCADRPLCGGQSVSAPHPRQPSESPSPDSGSISRRGPDGSVCRPFSSDTGPRSRGGRVLPPQASDAIALGISTGRAHATVCESYPSASCSYRSPFDSHYTIQRVQVKRISWIGHRAYYDLHVPGHEHYHAGGLWHHNTGKTTLAEIIANEQNYYLASTTGNAIRNPFDMYKVLFELQEMTRHGLGVGMLFIDEIHELCRGQGLGESELLPLFERGVFHCPSIAGLGIEVHAPNGVFGHEVQPVLVMKYPWVAVGATTEPGMLSDAMRRRFKCECFMRPYTVSDMEKIVARYSRTLGVGVTRDAELTLAARARANPARAISLLEACRNRLAAEDARHVDGGLVLREMRSQGIHDNGLTDVDVRILTALRDCPTTKRGDRMGLGLSSIGDMLSMSPNAVSKVWEPYLKQIGFLVVASRRKITGKGLAYLAGLA